MTHVATTLWKVGCRLYNHQRFRGTTTARELRCGGQFVVFFAGLVVRTALCQHVLVVSVVGLGLSGFGLEVFDRGLIRGVNNVIGERSSIVGFSILFRLGYDFVDLADLVLFGVFAILNIRRVGVRVVCPTPFGLVFGGQRCVLIFYGEGI